jgi:hypothetical protein
VLVAIRQRDQHVKHGRGERRLGLGHASSRSKITSLSTIASDDVAVKGFGVA